MLFFLFLFENRGNLLQQIPDRQMLRANPFTLSTADTRRSFPMFFRKLRIAFFLIPVPENLFHIQSMEQIGDQDSAGASVHAVATSCTGNRILFQIDLPHFSDRFMFRVAQRAKRFHEPCVVFDLLHIAHSGEDHCNIFMRCSKSYRPGWERNLRICLL